MLYCCTKNLKKENVVLQLALALVEHENNIHSQSDWWQWALVVAHLFSHLMTTVNLLTSLFYYISIIQKWFTAPFHFTNMCNSLEQIKYTVHLMVTLSGDFILMNNCSQNYWYWTGSYPLECTVQYSPLIVTNAGYLFSINMWLCLQSCSYWVWPLVVLS